LRRRWASASRRPHLETLERAPARRKKLTVDRNGNLDLSIIRRGDIQSRQK
jgi:hypothetical protein